jgi:hypothetical protein
MRQTLFVLEKDIQYAVNPAANVDVKEIQAAIVNSSLINLNGGSTSGIFPESNNTSWRTDYYDTYCMVRSAVGNINRLDLDKISEDNSVVGYSLKIMVNLKRKNAPVNTQNILLTYYYPITAGKIGLFAGPPTSDPDTRFNGSVFCYGQLTPQVSNTFLTSFCQSTSYKTPARGFLTYKKSVDDFEGVMKEINEKEQQEKKSMNSKVFPNPVLDKFKISGYLSADSPILIYLDDVFGNRTQLLSQENVPVGDFNFEFERGTLNAGLYICTVQSNRKKETVKLIMKKSD